MSAYTPGPWEFSSDGIWAVSPFNARVKIATITFGNMPSNGIDPNANGRLIAVAPKLLAALKAIKQATIEGRVCDDVAWFSQIETLHDYCDHFITEAEGSPIAAHTAGQRDV